MAQSTAQPQRPPLFPEGTVVRGKWRTGEQIGVGAFGEIYIARNIVTNEQVAIKAELNDEKKQALRAEVAILRRLQGCPYVCQFISCGRQEEVNFLVMELLGENLSELRKRLGTFTQATCARLVVEMLRALQAIHELGIVHRDVKPSNFVMGRKPGTTRRLFIIDFGLSRKYTGPAGEIKPPRPSAGFRGTARYASVYSHACKELSPRDDLWSVLYLTIEFATGTLPWKAQRDRDKIAEMKNYYLSRRLVEGLPAEYEDFMNHLQTLDYYSRPNYSYLIGLFDALARRLGATPETPYDWETDNAAQPNAAIPLRQVPPKGEPKMLKVHAGAIGIPSAALTPSKPDGERTLTTDFGTLPLPGIDDIPPAAGAHEGDAGQGQTLAGVVAGGSNGELRKSGGVAPAGAQDGAGQGSSAAAQGSSTGRKGKGDGEVRQGCHCVIL